MKKVIVGSAAVGAVIGLGPVVKRRIGHKMREHCQQMAAKCNQMMAGQSLERGEAAGMPEHCKQMAAQLRADEGPAETRGQSEQDRSRHDRGLSGRGPARTIFRFAGPKLSRGRVVTPRTNVRARTCQEKF